jgi:hypothetical protein
MTRVVRRAVSASRRLDRPSTMMIVAALLATLTIAITGSSGSPARVVAAPPILTTAPVTPPVPTTSPATTRPAPPATAKPVALAVTTAPPGPPPEPSIVQAGRLTRSSPVRLQIASIGVDSSLMKLGLRADGTLEVPPGGFPAGWYTGGPTPGERGPAVIAGHVDMNGPGVFYKLQEVRPGDLVMVTRADGSRPVFRVSQVGQYTKSQFPSQLVYGNLNHPGLRLITCGGTFNAATGHYESNIVAFADLIGVAR